MRRWIEHLITHAGAYEDFNNYMKEVEKSLNDALLPALLNDEVDRARTLAAELNAYRTISKKVKVCARERQSQITYQEQLK